MDRMIVRNWLLALGLTIICYAPAMSQESTRSPYSFSGLGQLSYQGFIQQQAMGGTGRSIHEKGSFSFTNPASLGNLEFTDYEFSAGMDIVSQEIAGASSQYTLGSFNYMALGMPLISGKMGLAFGIMPYSKVGYQFNSSVMEDSNQVEYVFEGNGGLNQIVLGIGGEVFKGFTLGLRADYTFGNITQVKFKDYVGSKDIYSFADEDNTWYTGFGLGIGAQYIRQIGSNLRLDLGATYSLNNTLQANNDRLVATINSSGDFTIDTLLQVSEPAVDVTVPMSYGGSIAIGNPGQWRLAAEYSNEFWSEFTDFTGISGFNDRYACGVGGYFQLQQLEDQSESALKSIDKLKTVRVYGGVRFERGYHSFYGQSIDEFGITFGLGLPVRSKKLLPEGNLLVVSRINITGEILKRGTTDNNLIEENFFRLNVGFNFNDKWFIKRKFQ